MGKHRGLTMVVAPWLAFALAACGGEEAPPPEPAEPPAAPGASTTPIPPPAAAPSNVELPDGVTAEMVAQGDALFHGNGICFSCHGQQGVGTPLGPPLNDQTWLNLAAGSYDEIVGIVRTGVPQPKEFPAPMLPMGGATFDDDQLNQVAAYVFSISRGG